jgi:hypothetical protein
MPQNGLLGERLTVCNAGERHHWQPVNYLLPGVYHIRVPTLPASDGSQTIWGKTWLLFWGDSMPHRRRLVFVQTQNERKNAGFTVDERATAVDVSLRLREVGWTPYKVRLESDTWIAIVIDWQRAA